MNLVCDKCLISTFICIVLRVDVIFLGQSQINYYLIGTVPYASVSFFEGGGVRTRCQPTHTGNCTLGEET